jgi:hypothetical protein
LRKETGARGGSGQKKPSATRKNGHAAGKNHCGRGQNDSAAGRNHSTVEKITVQQEKTSL